MYCTGCHGADLKGTPAGTSLLAESLKYGNEPADISKVISNGIPNTTMIKWSNTLPSHEIGELTEYIIGIRKNQTTQEKSTENLAFSTEDYTLKVEKIVTEGLVFPWGIEFVDTQRALITGNKGELYWVVDGKLDPKRVTGIPFIYGTDLVGGMMDLALDPNYAENGWIYFAYSHNPKNTADKTSPAMTKLVRGKIKNYQWVDQETLFEAPDSILVSGGTRWGSRLLFDTEGYLYFTTGDMQQSIAEGLILSCHRGQKGKYSESIRMEASLKTIPTTDKKGCFRESMRWAPEMSKVLPNIQSPEKSTLLIMDPKAEMK